MQQPSGADKGFFYAAPILQNQFYDDPSFRRCFKLFLPENIAAECEAEVAKLGDDVLSDQVFNWVSDAERNKPYLKGSGRDALGRWVGELVTGEGWKGLREFRQSRGIVAAGYDTPYGVFARPLQFLRMHLWEASSADVTCPSAMQDGAAALMRRRLEAAELTDEERSVFEDAYARLTSRDPGFAWTSGQWMTERARGGKLSSTEAVAEHRPDAEPALACKGGDIPLGPWSISGFPWFASATTCNMAILLARTPKGLTTFYAPMHKHDPDAKTMTGRPKTDGTSLNGVWIQRLKNKPGTQALPAAELVLDEMRGWQMGQEGEGVEELATVLTLTRIHNLITALGYVGRGLGIARAYARRREVGGRSARMKLTESAPHMRTLAKMTAEYHGLMLLSLFCCYNLGLTEQEEDGVVEEVAPLSPALQALTPPREQAGALLRVVVQLAKAYVCKTCVPLLYSCMESLGGSGYLVDSELEYLNVARLYRDSCILPIWEGTTDALSTEFIRTLKRESSLDALEGFIRRAYAHESSLKKPDGWDPMGKWAALRRYVDGRRAAELVGEGREILWDVADLLISVMLWVDAGRDGDGGVEEVFRRFCEGRLGGTKRERGSGTEELSRDLTIVYGSEGVQVVTEVVKEVIYKDIPRAKL